ncbi:U3 snoRNP protein Utp20 [Ceratobasidium sp. AG-Ba]|nr:U3 snoRNP protein Utp20 [Ceratobasidium sp. AG-Ba]
METTQTPSRLRLIRQPGRHFIRLPRKASVLPRRYNPAKDRNCQFDGQRITKAIDRVRLPTTYFSMSSNNAPAISFYNLLPPPYSAPHPNLLLALLSLLCRKLALDVLELLLSALTTHLKFFVLPNSTTALDSAWNGFRSTRESIGAHVPMVAEVWGHVKPKLKKEKEWGSRAKQAQGVYISATDLTVPLADLRINGNGNGTSRIIRRVATALIHHSGAESFAGVAGIIPEKLEIEVATAENKNVEQEDRLIRAMEVATVMCEVRKGGKSTSATVSTQVSWIPRMLAILTPRPETRTYAMAVLAARDMAAWVRPGRSALDAVWQVLTEGTRKAAILSELGWGRWKSMVLPHVLRRTPKALTTSPTQTLSVLARLYSAYHELARHLDALSPILLNASSGVSRIVRLLQAQGEKDGSLAGVNGVGRLDAGLAEAVERWGQSESVIAAQVEVQCRISAGGTGDMQGVIVRWLPIQNNLRPFWTPSAQILGILANEEVWHVLFEELEAVCKQPGSLDLRAPGDGVGKRERMYIDEGESKEEWQEEENTLRYPSTSVLLKALVRWNKSRIVASGNPESPGWLDLANFETRLLLTLGGIPSITDKHTRPLVPVFFECSAPAVKAPRAKTVACLTMLSELGNPKAAYRSQDLHLLSSATRAELWKSSESVQSSQSFAPCGQSCSRAV